MPQIRFSMNGWRHQLSDQVAELRNIAKDILADELFDKDDLKGVVTQLICMSNSVNCASIEGDPDFADMSDLEVAHLDETEQDN